MGAIWLPWPLQKIADLKNGKNFKWVVRGRGVAISWQGNSGSGLKIMYTNIRSVVNKIDELKIYASLTQPDIIAITETWTNYSVSNHFLTLPNYAIISRHDQNDTKNRRGGGLLIYAKVSLKDVEST